MIRTSKIIKSCSKYFLIRWLILILFSAISGTRCFDLKCTLKIRTWDYLGSINYYDASGFNIKASNETVTSLNGRIDAHSNVYGFEVRNEQVGNQLIPRGIEKFLPNLKLINIYNSKLQSIRQSDLKRFPLLTHLRLDSNEIEVIPDNLFAFNPELKTIFFHGNIRLKAVGQNVIPAGLEVAWFQNCGCVNVNAEKNADLPELQRKIRERCITPEAFRNSLFGDDFDALDKKVLELKFELDKKTFENDWLHQEQSRVEALNQKVLELKRKLDEKTSEVDFLERQRLDLETKWSSKHIELQKETLEKEELKSKFADIIVEKGATNERLKSLEQDLARKETELASCTTYFNILKADLICSSNQFDVGVVNSKVKA